MKQKDEVRYLGCLINARGDPGREVSKRIKDCMTTLTQMHIFFRHGDSSITRKLQVYDAVIASKLMYGLESVVFNDSVADRLDSFQLKGLRKILHIPTTYYNCKYTNEYVFAAANKALQDENKNNLQRISVLHACRRKTLLAKLIVLGKDEPSATVTFDVDTMRPHDYGKLRVGRPRIKWLSRTLAEAWTEANDGAAGTSEFQPGNQLHMDKLRAWALEYDDKHHWSQKGENFIDDLGPFGDEAPSTPPGFGPFGLEPPVTPERNRELDSIPGFLCGSFLGPGGGEE